jgi:hypothetical protein
MSSVASHPPLLSRCAFDLSTPSTSSYLQVCGDDSVKLWSVAGACVLKHFLLPPKAASAITAHSISSVDSKSKKKGQQQRQLIAVGTATGSVVLFDATAGECKWSVRDSSASGAVTACAIDAPRARIFTAATDCSLVARSLDDGSAEMTFKVGKHHAACIAVSPDGTQLVAAGAFIKLFSVASQALLCRYSSSASAVTHAAFSPCGTVFATCGSQRSVSMWSTSPSHSNAPLRILTLDAAPLACCFSAYSTTTTDIAAVSSSGAAFVWRVQQSAAQLLPSDTPLQPALHLKRPAGDGQQVLALRFVAASSLALARGGSVLPHFEEREIAMAAAGAAAGAVVELSKLSKAALLPPPPATSAAAAAAAVAVSVADASAMLVPHSASSARVDTKRSKSAAVAAAADDDEVVDAAGDLADGDVGAEGEESLGDRARRMGGDVGSASSRLEAPKADSVAVLLQQGLQVTYKAPRSHVHVLKFLFDLNRCWRRSPPPSSSLPHSFFFLQAGDDAMVEQVPHPPLPPATLHPVFTEL